MSTWGMTALLLLFFSMVAIRARFAAVHIRSLNDGPPQTATPFSNGLLAVRDVEVRGTDSFTQPIDHAGPCSRAQWRTRQGRQRFSPRSTTRPSPQATHHPA